MTVYVVLDSGKLSEVSLYKAVGITDINSELLWRNGYLRLNANTDYYIYFNNNGEYANKQLVAIVFAFSLSIQQTSDNAPITITIEEKNGNWTQVFSKTIDLLESWQEINGTKYNTSNAIIYTLKLDNPITLSSNQYRIVIRTTKTFIQIAIKQYAFTVSDNDLTNYVRLLLVFNETASISDISNAYVLVASHTTLTLDTDILTYVNAGTGYGYYGFDTTISLVLATYSTLVISTAKNQYHIGGTVVLAAMSKIATDEVIEDPITIYLGGHFLLFAYLADIKTRLLGKRIAKIKRVIDKRTIVLDGVFDTWKVGDVVYVMTDNAYEYYYRNTIADITVDYDNNETTITLSTSVTYNPILYVVNATELFIINTSLNIQYRYAVYMVDMYEKTLEISFKRAYVVHLHNVANGGIVHDESTSFTLRIYKKIDYIITRAHMLLMPQTYEKTHIGTLVQAYNYVSLQYSIAFDKFISIRTNVALYIVDSQEIEINELAVSTYYAVRYQKLSYLYIGEIKGVVTSALIYPTVSNAYVSLIHIHKIDLLRKVYTFVLNFGGGRIIVDFINNVNYYSINASGNAYKYSELIIRNVGLELNNSGVYSNFSYIIESTGTGLSDTTVRSGNRAMKIYILRNVENKIEYYIPVVSDGVITLRMYVKFSGTWEYFKIRITLPDGNVVEKSVPIESDWTPVVISAISQSDGIAKIEYVFEGNSGSVAYVDDEVLITSYDIDISGEELWVNGQPIRPPLKTKAEPIDLWLIEVDRLNMQGTIGKYIVDNLKKIIDEIRKNANKIIAFKFV